MKKGKEKFGPSNWGLGENFDALKVNLQYLSDNIQFADAKVGIVSTLSLALIAVIIDQGFSNFQKISETLIYFSIALLSISVILGLIAIFPRKINVEGNLLFWGSISKLHSSKHFAEQFASQKNNDLFQQFSDQVFSLSKILSKKYTYISISLIVFATGVILFILANLIH